MQPELPSGEHSAPPPSGTVETGLRQRLAQPLAPVPWMLCLQATCGIAIIAYTFPQVDKPTSIQVGKLVKSKFACPDGLFYTSHIKAWNNRHIHYGKKNCCNPPKRRQRKNNNCGQSVSCITPTGQKGIVS